MTIELTAVYIEETFDQLEAKLEQNSDFELSRLIADLRTRVGQLSELAREYEIENHDLRIDGIAAKSKGSLVSNSQFDPNNVRGSTSERTNPYCPNCHMRCEAIRLENFDSVIARYFCRSCRYMVD